MEMYQKTEAVRRALQLRRGNSFYGSMPETLLARRGSAPQPFVALKQRMLQAAVSRGGGEERYAGVGKSGGGFLPLI